jgi:hypothetical protein
VRVSIRHAKAIRIQTKLRKSWRDKFINSQTVNSKEGFVVYTLRPDRRAKESEKKTSIVHVGDIGVNQIIMEHTRI